MINSIKVKYLYFGGLLFSLFKILEGLKYNDVHNR